MVDLLHKLLILAHISGQHSCQTMTGADHQLDNGKIMEFYVAMVGDNITLKSIHLSSYTGILFAGKVMTISRALM